MNNERLKLLLDTLVKLVELRKNVNFSDSSYSINTQIDFIRKLINAECKK